MRCFWVWLATTFSNTFAKAERPVESQYRASILGGLSLHQAHFAGCSLTLDAGGGGEVLSQEPPGTRSIRDSVGLTVCRAKITPPLQ